MKFINTDINNWLIVPVFLVFLTMVIGLLYVARWFGLDPLHVILIVFICVLLGSRNQD